MTHELDNAAYYALIGPQTRFAERLGGALRYHPDVSGFCALPDEPTPDDWNNLAALAGDEVVLFRDRLEVCQPRCRTPVRGRSGGGGAKRIGDRAHQR